MAGYGENDTLVEFAGYGENDTLVSDETAKKAKPKDDRTFLETANDYGASLNRGIGSTVEMVGTGYGLLTGDMDNAVRNKGAEFIKRNEAVMTPYKKQQDADREARLKQIETDDGALAAFLASAGETLTDPASLVEQLPQLVIGGGGGKVAKYGIGKLAGAAAGTTAGVATAVGTNAVMEGADPAGDAYNRLLKLPDEQWQKNPDYQAALAENGGDVTAAKADVALGLSRKVGAASAALALATSYIPGARAIDKALVGGSTGVGGMLRSGVTGFLGEAAQETAQEGFGAFSTNYAAQQVDPNQALSEGVAIAAGKGAGIGGPMGGVAGAASGYRTDTNADPIPGQPTVDAPTQGSDITNADIAALQTQSDDALAAISRQPDAASATEAFRVSTEAASRAAELSTRAVDAASLLDELNAIQQPAELSSQAAEIAAIQPAESLSAELARLNQIQGASTQQPGAPIVAGDVANFATGFLAQPNGVTDATQAIAQVPAPSNQAGRDLAGEGVLDAVDYGVKRRVLGDNAGDLAPGMREAVPAGTATGGADAVASATTNERTNSLAKTASWVIREKATGNVIMETFDKAKVEALNTDKYEAVPILQHLQEINTRLAPVQNGTKPEQTMAETNASGESEMKAAADKTMAETGIIARVGVSPNSTEPVTVENGVVKIGRHAALDFETAEPITVAPNAGFEQVSMALRNGKALSSKQRIYQGEKGMRQEPKKAQKVVATTADEYGQQSRKEFIAILKKMGGITTKEARDITGENALQASRMSPGLFSGDGNALDLVARRLHEAGYISDEAYNESDGGVQAARDLVGTALAKEFVGTQGQHERLAELEAMEADLAAQVAEIESELPAAAETLAEVIASETSLEGMSFDEEADLPDFKANMNEAEAMRALGFTEDEINEATGQYREAAEGADAGRPQEGAESGAAEEAVGGNPAQEGGVAEETFGLSQQTPAQAEAADKAAKRAAERARIEASKPSGPDVTADQVDLFATQGGLFNSNRDEVMETPVPNSHVNRINADTGETINEKVAPLVEALNASGLETHMSGDLYGNDLVYVDLTREAAKKINPSSLPAPWVLTYKWVPITNRDVLGIEIPQKNLSQLANHLAADIPRRIARKGGAVSEAEAARVVSALTKEADKASQPTEQEWHQAIAKARAEWDRMDRGQRSYLAAQIGYKNFKNGKEGKSLALHEWGDLPADAQRVMAIGQIAQPVQQSPLSTEPEQPFDSEAFNKSREDTIKESKAAGNKHLDDVQASVETMRGKAIYYAHNPKQRGVIRTVDNRGNVYVHWADEYTAQKELASETEETNKTWLKSTKSLPYMRNTRDGRTFVFQSSLGQTDLKDYVFGDGNAVAKTEPEQPVEANKQAAIDAIKQSDIPAAEQIRLLAELRQGKIEPGDVQDVVGKVEPEATPSESMLKDLRLLQEARGKWQYKFSITGGWMTANTKEDAVDRATETYLKTPKDERLTKDQRGAMADAEAFSRSDKLYGSKTIDELRAERARLGGEIAGDQKAGAREFNGNGGRRTSAAVSNEAARANGEEAMRLDMYIREREKQEQESKTKQTDTGTAMFSRSTTAFKSIEEIEAAWDARGIQNTLYEKDGIIRLTKIIVPKADRGHGLGTAAMQELLAYADATGQQVALTPSSDFGGSKTRLAAFYRGLGFRKYKGFAVRETLIRDPEVKAMFSRKADEDFVQNVLAELSANDELFRYPVSQKASLPGVMGEVLPSTEYVGDDTREDERTESGADRRFAFKSPQGRNFYVYERSNMELWIDVSRLEEGFGGAGVYAAVANYAHNAKKVFIGDPNGLSDSAVIRRTSNMLSSTLRFGATDHLDAAPEQISGNPDKGIEPLEWKGSDVDKVNALIHTFTTTIYNQFPKLDGYRYDFQDQRFVDRNGREVTAERFRLAASSADARTSKSGEATLRRGIFLQSLMASEDGARSGILEQVLTRSNSLVTDGNLGALFSRKDYTESTPSPAQDNDGRTDATAGRDIQILEATIERGLGGSVSARNAYRATTLPGHDALTEIAGAFGARIRGFAVTRDTKQLGFFNGVYISGVRDSIDTIYLNESAQRPHLSLLGHELVHRLRNTNPELYAKFVEAVKLYIDPDRYRVWSKLWVETGDKLTEEFMGEVVSDGFLNKDFWQAVANRNKGMFRSIQIQLSKLIDQVFKTVGYTPKTKAILNDYAKVMQIAGEIMGEHGISQQELFKMAGVDGANFSRTSQTTGESNGQQDNRTTDATRGIGGDENTEAAGSGADSYQTVAPADIRFSRQQPIPGTTQSQSQQITVQPPLGLPPGFASNQAAWSEPIDSAFDDFIYKWQNKLVDTKRVVESVIASTGQLADKWNVYLQEELFHGRAAKHTLDFVDRELNPILEQARGLGLSLDEIDTYLWARHAKEANALILQRDPNMDDGSGLSDQQADDMLNGVDVKVNGKTIKGIQQNKVAGLQSVATRIDATIASTRQLYADYGLESQDKVDEWGDMFQHYVPLMREDKDGAMGIGQGYSIKGKEVKHRTGSTRAVVDILANIAMQREKVIVRGEKNRVAVSLAGLAKLNPNKDFWTFDKVPTERVMNEKTGLVEERADPMYKSKPNVIVAKIRGKNGQVEERAIVFNESDPRALRMAEALKNLDVAQLEGWMGVSARITRYFSAINTQYNPVFGFVNLTRDVQGAILNLSSTPLKDHKTAIFGHTFSALAGIYRDSRAERKGVQASSAWATEWEEFTQEGGQTGYRDLFRTSEDRANKIRDALDPDRWMDSKLGKIFTAGGLLKVPLQVAKITPATKWIFDLLSDFNLTMENAVRLSAYKVAKEQGMSKQQAASLAKNLTVNFNRKGQVGQQAGALYAFFNASMQGTARIAETMTTMEPGDIKTLRLSGAGKAIVGGGVLLGAMQAVMLAAMGFDDDEPPEFVRERNIIIPVGGKKYITIPMPLGYHFIPNIGRVLTEVAMDGGKDGGKRLMGLFGVAAEAFNPIGGTASLQTISPTALDPFVAIGTNKDWTGKPVYREDFNKLSPTPGFTRTKDTASSWSKALSEAVNYATGGTKYTPGTYSPTPDELDYLFDQVTGGVGRETSKLNQTVSAMASGEELPTYKIPLVGRYYGSSEGQAGQANKFYENLKQANAHEAEIKGRRKDHLPTGEYVRDYPGVSMLVANANRAERKVSELRRHKRELVEQDASRDKIKLVEERITTEMLRFNERSAEIEKRWAE